MRSRDPTPFHWAISTVAIVLEAIAVVAGDGLETYRYHCSYRSRMTGTTTVKASE
jgi:hypothetical protein